MRDDPQDGAPPTSPIAFPRRGGCHPEQPLARAAIVVLLFIHLAASRIGTTLLDSFAIGEPDDYVLATGRTHSVRYFVERAFAEIGVEIEWLGHGVSERGIDSKTHRVLVEVDPRYFRPTEVDILVGDATKARTRLGWTATTRLEDMIAEMVREDLHLLRSDKGSAAIRAFEEVD